MKQQFNVYLEPALIGRLKHRAIDESLSLSALVGHVFETFLSSKGTAMASTPQLSLQPLVHVAGRLSDSVRFYEALGAELIVGSRDGDYALMRLGSSEIGLLAHPPNPEQHEQDVELCFTSDQPLGEVEAVLRERGVSIVRGAADEAFGEQLQIESPDGLLVKINRLDPSTFS